MESEYKPTPVTEKFPQQLVNFIKQNPNMKCENLYLCESVDMDGNVVDTKIGVNLLTNYGLKNHFVDGRNAYTEMWIWLGTGNTAPDPASSTLTSYISSLGQGSGREYWENYKFPYEFDQATQIWTLKLKVFKCYWDYTAGGNAEFSIWELGMGETSTTLRTHALIYDEHGQQTCIVKRPNTRLYITAYWTASVSMADVPQMYVDGKFLFIDPHMAMPNYGIKSMYWDELAQGVLHNYNLNRVWDNYQWYWYTDDDSSVITGDPREVHYEGGPGSDNSVFWEGNWLYTSGWYIGVSDWPNRYQRDTKSSGYFAMFVFDLLPVAEEMETYYAYPNKSYNQILDKANSSYTGTEADDWDLLRLDENFGVGQTYHIDCKEPTNWGDPKGILPCTQFHITELNFYNYITKQWDVSIPFKDEPDTIYSDHWTYFYLALWVTYNGIDKEVYVFANMTRHDPSTGTPIGHITAFDNTNMVIAATDAYWDVSTYVEIPNLNAVPAALQQKRYYVVVAGTVNKLNPVMPRNDWHYHELRPTNMPFELTLDADPKFPRIPNYISESQFYYERYSTADAYSYSYTEANTFGSVPLLSPSKGYFVVANMLIFCDDQWNTTVYNLLVEDKYPTCKHRRYITKNGDKILMFSTRVCTQFNNGVPGSTITRSYAIAANNFTIWTVTDENSAPTAEDFVLVWSDPTEVSTNQAWHLYSWSDYGYLVVAKRSTEPEFIWVDVYGANGVEMHLVQNACHARAIENTTCCCYQDMNLSMGNEYVFRIFDMSENDIIDTITVNDGTNYTVLGIYGYNEHVYIRLVSSDNTDYTYYYNSNTKSLEKLDWTFNFMKSTMPYSTYKTLVYDDYAILTYCHNGSGHTFLIHGNSNHRIFNETTVNVRASYEKCFPCINLINDGKQLIFAGSGRSNNSETTAVFDLGLLLDSESKIIDHVPYDYYAVRDTNNGRDMTGPLIPWNNGIIRFVTSRWSGYNYKIGRAWWFPIEMCMPMHMKGTTRTLNSYNAPVRWYLDRKVKWNVTNDLSRLIPNGGE